MLVVLLVGCLDALPDQGPASEVWVSGWFDDAVVRFDASGDLVGRVDGVDGAQAIVPWQGGALVVAEGAGQVLAIDAAGDRTVWADGLASPTGLAPLPDGTFAVASFTEDRVMRYDADGLFVEDLVVGVAGADAGLSVDALGRLWVPCFESNEVVVVDDGGVVLTLRVNRPRVVRHDAAGTAWISSWGTGALRRYDPDGTSLDPFVQRVGITGIAFDGRDVWVASDQEPMVHRYDRITSIAREPIDPGLDGVTFVQVVPVGQ